MANIKSQVILSPPDERDFRVGASVDISNDFPESFEVFQPPVEDQGDVGNCVAQSLANIFETWRNREGDKHKDFSVGYIYGNSDFYGMIPRDACAAVCKEGDVLREVWECFDENPKCHRKKAELSEDIKAQAIKMAEYVRIYTISELKAFMLKYRLPVMIIAEGKHYSAFCSGYHATACYGWNEKDELLYTNSWGTGGMYGDGKGKMQFNKIEEIWGVIPIMNEEITFTDTSGHWAEKQIEEMAKLGIIKGYEDGSFKPDKAVTRAEVAAMLCRAINVVRGIADSNY